MADFYQPTLLFRQNAIRRAGDGSFAEPDYKVRNSSWIFDSNTTKDTKILNKVCSLDRLNIKSNYWKIPDNNMHLTSMATKVLGNEGTLAISSGNQKSNLFIYELDLDNTYLTHHNTITLPNIYSMKWVPNTPNLLMTGNGKGYAHLISVPDSNNPEESAEIIKRFNHRKHLRSINKDPSIFQHKSTIIEKMAFNSLSSMVSIYDNNLFNWDLQGHTTSVRPKPISITSINGLTNFDTSINSNILGICGKFGVSIFDLRDPAFSVPEASNNETKKSKLATNLLKWSPVNENIFAASHLDGVIRLWDIRKQESFGSLHAEHGKLISSLEWVDGDLFSGGKNGRIIHWDLTSDVSSYDSDLKNCGLKEGLHSVHFDPQTNRAEKIAGQRQCGTVLPASNTNIISLESVETSDDLKVLSIDGSSFFGLHSRIYDAVDITYASKKAYYTAEDIRLMTASQETSNDTLVDDELVYSVSTKPLEFTKPLEVKRNRASSCTSSIQEISTPSRAILVRSVLEHSIKNITHNNDSNDTLLDVPIESSKLDIDFDFSPRSRQTSSSSSSSDIASPESFNSSTGTVDTVATSMEGGFTPSHKYQLSDIRFDDDLTFDHMLTL